MTTKLGPGTVTCTYADGSKESFDVDAFTIDPQKPTPVSLQIELPEMSAAARIDMQRVLAWEDRAKSAARRLLFKAWAEPPSHLPLAPGPRARGKAQWKRERFTR